MMRDWRDDNGVVSGFHSKVAIVGLSKRWCLATAAKGGIVVVVVEKGVECEVGDLSGGWGVG